MVSRKPLGSKIKCVSERDRDRHLERSDTVHKSNKNCRDLRGCCDGGRNNKLLNENISQKGCVIVSQDWEWEIYWHNASNKLSTLKVVHRVLFESSQEWFHVYYHIYCKLFWKKKLANRPCWKSFEAKRVIIRLLQILLGDDEVLLFIAG